MHESNTSLTTSLGGRLEERTAELDRTPLGSQANYLLLLESAPDAIVISDRHGVITSVNGQTLALFGYESGELLGEPVETLIPEGARKPHVAHRAGYVAAPKIRPMGTGLTLHGLRKDRSEFPIEVSLSCLEVEDRLLVCSIIRDVTDREERNRELRESAARYRALSGQLIQAREMERRRVARDLHDGLNQELAQLSIEVGTLLSQLGADSEHAAKLRRLQERLTSVASDVRRVSRQLHPAALESLGLPAALQTLCAELRGHGGLEVDVVAGGAFSALPFEVAVNLYRIVQESLQNVMRHAHAKSVTVSLIDIGASLELTVTDDGQGFDVDAARSRSGLGLVSMEERARLAGGTVAIASMPGRGSRVRVTIPLASRA